MSQHKIGWLNMPGYKPETWNPVIGCTEKSEGCKNCFAKRMAHRLMHMPHTSYYQFVLANNGAKDPEEFRNLPEWNGQTHFVRYRLYEPSKWKNPRMVFVCDMGDLFHETVPFSWIDRIIDQAALYDHKHIFVILTKRPEIMKKYFEELSLNTGYKPLSNIWIGVTAENQEQANKRIPILLQIPAAKHFVSIEPMLGPIDLECFPETGCPNNFISDLDWVICGGESGHKARPMHPDWVRDLRDQCKAAGVPFFFKQWGTLAPFSTVDGRQILPFDYMKYNPETKEGYVRGRKDDRLDGQQHHEWPKINL